MQRGPQDSPETHTSAAGFLTAVLIAAPGAFLWLLLDDPGPAQGRGPESGSAALLGPVVGLAYLVAAAFVAAIAGVAGAVATSVALRTGRPSVGYAVAVAATFLVYVIRDEPGLPHALQAITLLGLPAGIAVWRCAARSR